MPTRMNDFDRASDRKWQTHGKERGFTLLAIADTSPRTPPAARSSPSLAGTASP